MSELGDAEIKRLVEIVRRSAPDLEEIRKEVAKMPPWELESDRRIAKALSIAPDGAYDGDHHKMWVLDQMVRALTGCPMVTRSAVDANGENYSYEAQGESEEYERFVDEVGGWDEGIAP
jgi:hypothetical protein